MNTKINIILVLSFVLTLLSCKSAHKEKSEENEKHTDEIVFTQKQAAEAGVRLETVKYGDFQNVIKVGGQIQSAFGEEQTVVATADGIVSFAKSSVSDGIPISAGQSIVTISANKLQDGDPSQKAKNVYEAAEREYNRVKELVSERIISVKDFEQVRLRYETAKVAYLGLARNMTAHGVNVASHISGYIKNRYVKQGDYVSVGDPIVTVTQNRRLQLRAEIPERSYKDIKSIRGANFKTSCDDTLYKLSDLNGRLLSYGKSFDSNTFYLPVIFEFNNVGNLVAGSFAEVYLLAQPKKNVISVPVSALTEEQGVFYVYLQVKSEKEAFIKREVTIGLNNGDRVEITSGLSAGDVVVVKGAYQVKLAASTSAVPEGHSH